MWTACLKWAASLKWIYYWRRLCGDVQPLPVGRGGNNIWLDLIYFPNSAARIGSCCELSPNFTAAAFMIHVWTPEISPHKITLPQLLHCHTELSQAVDLIPRKSFHVSSSRRRSRSEEATGTSVRTSWAVPCIQKEVGSMIRDFSCALTLPCSVQMYGTP